MNRLYNLDYLRGLAAFGIMIFHYFSWALGKFSADTFMGRIGLYGVSMFYVLSGLTLYFVYYHKMGLNKEDVLDFFKRRVFRIFPLLWVVTIVAILLSNQKPDVTDLLLNLSGLFGFLRWERYFSAGVWSIGNELVFYVFFPFFVLFTRHMKPAMLALALLLFGFYLYFAFIRLQPTLTLNEQWAVYIHPMNQVFLFMSGFLLGYALQRIQVPNIVALGFIAAGIVLFVLYPAAGDPVTLITGVNRLVFTVCCLLVCAGFYKLSLTLPGIIHQPLSLLGEASYAVYLLHPLVWTISGILCVWLKAHTLYVPLSVRLVLACITTLVLGYFVYQYVEKYFMQLGRKGNAKPTTNLTGTLRQVKR